jgi:hypothetical protein
MTELMYQVQYYGLPLPDEMEAFTLILWAGTLMFGFYCGTKALRRKRAFRRRVVQFTLAIIVFVTVFLAMTSFDQRRIFTSIDKADRTITSVVLPIVSCGTASEYFPGGRSVGGASVDDLREAANDPQCHLYTLLSRLIYLLLSASTYLFAGLILAGLVPFIVAAFAGSQAVWSWLLKHLKDAE